MIHDLLPRCSVAVVTGGLRRRKRPKDVELEMDGNRRSGSHRANATGKSGPPPSTSFSQHHHCCHSPPSDPIPWRPFSFFFCFFQSNVTNKAEEEESKKEKKLEPFLHRGDHLFLPCSSPSSPYRRYPNLFGLRRWTEFKKKNMYYSLSFSLPASVSGGCPVTVPKAVASRQTFPCIKN